LGDPLYPLADRIFHPTGLVEPLWNATQAEIRGTALNAFGGGQGGPLLTVHESAVALASTYLLPVGLATGLIVGLWQAWRGDKRSAYLASATILVLVAVLAPGWY